MPNNPVIIVDGNNYAYRAYYAYARMKANNGTPSALVYGIPVFIKKLITDFNPSKVLVVFDGNRHQKRMEINPGYKKGRGTKIGFDPESFHSQKDDAMELLHKGLGIPVYRNKGQEADDIIYKLVRSHCKTNDVVICSSDKDFNQLVDSSVSIWNHSKELLIQPDNCKKHFGYEPSQCVDYLCLDGDKSDGITGYRGIGEAKAKDFINKHSIKDFLKNDLSYPRINNDKLAEIYRINRTQIDLKYFNRRYNKRVKPALAFKSKPGIDKSVIDDISIKYSTNSFRVKTFIKAFQL